MYALFVAALLAQVIVGRTQLLAMRGYIDVTGGIFTSLLNMASGTSFFALIVWGFASLSWYLALPTMLVIGVLAGFIVNLKLFAFWYQTRTFIDLIAVGLTIFLWVNHYPF